jgi:O-Antigen ligase
VVGSSPADSLYIWPMSAARTAALGALLAGPTALAFFSGGYFDRPRLWAGVIVWIVVAVAALAYPRPLPRSGAAWLAVGGLTALTAWTAISITWAPLRDVAQADAERLVLYVGVLVAGIAAFRSRAAARAAEPVLALGTVLVIAEGLSERFLPGLFTLARSEASQGRLSQPLTYWNAMGLLAAIGLVLTARLAGDPTRSTRMRVAAAAAGPFLGVGLYITLSRGAILAAAVGLVLLVMLRPTRSQLRAAGVLLVTAAPAVLAAGLLPGARAFHGTLAARELQGAAMIVVLLATSLAAAAVAARGCRMERVAGLPVGPVRGIQRGARLAGVLAAAATLAIFVSLLATTHKSGLNPIQGASTARLANVESNRGDFWRVALRAFRDHPVRGVGSGGFAVEWLRHRTIAYAARDAHSIYIETLAELGILGALALAAFLAGIGVCARRALRLDPELTTGWIAVVVVWAVHAGLDWDWEVPAVTLIALLLAAALVAQADEGRPSVETELPADRVRVPELTGSGVAS